MVGGLLGGIEDTSTVRRSDVFRKQAFMIACVAVIALVYRLTGATGLPLAGQSGFALAAIIPLATMRGPRLRRPRTSPAQEAPALAMTPELSAL